MSKNKAIFTVLVLIIGIGCFFTRRYLQKIYGFDPPYEYFFTGAFLEILGFILFIIGIISFIIFRRNPKSALK